MATLRGGRVDNIWDNFWRSVGMEVGRSSIKELRPEEEESVLRWAAATGFDVEGALEILRERYYKAVGVWSE